MATTAAVLTALKTATGAVANLGAAPAAAAAAGVGKIGVVAGSAATTMMGSLSSGLAATGGIAATCQAIGTTATGAVASLGAAPAAAAAAGIGKIGIVAGSAATTMMGSLSSGLAATGGIAATCQAIGTTATTYASVPAAMTLLKGATGAAVSLGVAPTAVSIIGFGKIGIAAGSTAATMMSMLGGAFTASGGIVATLQAIGATGSILVSAPAVITAGGIGAAISLFF